MNKRVFMANNIGNFSLLIILVSLSYNLNAQGSFSHIINGHSHNDYKQDIPLHDALDNGICSIEVDIILKKGEIVVSHLPFAICKRKNFEKLYLKELVTLIKKDSLDYCAEVTLMIEMKQGRNKLFLKLIKLLSKYDEYLTKRRGDKIMPGFIKIILTGKYPKKEIITSNYSFLFIDGEIDDLNSDINSIVMPRIGINYRKVTSTNKNNLSTVDKLLLKSIIDSAHASGKSIRFWKCPNDLNVWRELHNLGVDWINVDNIDLYAIFISSITLSRIIQYL